MDKVIDFLTSVGLEVPITAIAIVILTGLIKIPVKKLAERINNGKKITRFITLLPIIIGFGLTVLCTFLFTGEVNFNRDFYVQWFSSASLSLAIFAFIEKFVPSEKKILSEAEIKTNQTVIEELKSKLAETTTVSEAPVVSEEKAQSVEHTEEQQAVSYKKIVLSNNKNLK